MSAPLALLLVSVTLGQSTDAQARWEAERLERRSYEQVVAQATELEPLTSMPTAAAPITQYESAQLVRWGVFTGSGEQLDAFELARRVGDQATLDSLERKLKRTRIGGWISAGLGAGALGSGGVMVAQGVSQDDAPQVQSTVGAGLCLVGLVGTVAGLRLAAAPRRLVGEVDRAWEPQEVDALIEAHNRALREELGLN